MTHPVGRVKPAIAQPAQPRRVALRSTRPTKIESFTMRQRVSRAQRAIKPRRHGGRGAIRYHEGRKGYAKDAKSLRPHRDHRVSFASFVVTNCSVPPW